MKIHVNTQIDNKAVERAIKRSAPKTLRSAGAYVRAVAKNSIKTRKRRYASMPGTPPLSHPDAKVNNPGFKRTILFAVEGNSAYIGPRYVKGGFQNVGRLHEFGGSKTIKSISDPEKFEKGFKIGEKAWVTANNLSSRNDKVIDVSKDTEVRTGRKLFLIKLRTRTQAEHATRVYRRREKLKAKTKTVHYAPRPYMRPALTRSIPSLSKFWYNSVKP